MQFAEAVMSFALWGVLISEATHTLKIKYKNWRNVE